MKSKLSLLLISLLLSISSFAESPLCTMRSAVGAKCRVLIEKLAPTQIAVGLTEALERRKEFQRLSKEQLEKLLAKEPLPVVVAPSGRFYILDGHHRVFALWGSEVKDVSAEIEGNYSFVGTKKFWSLMKLRGWIYPFDERGQGPLAPEALPLKVSELKDDPYRSLAGQVRKRGAYNKPTVLYGEFYWANFFRTRIKMWSSPQEYEQAILKGIELARSKEASKLPGWKGKP